MKKITVILLILALSLSVFTACSSTVPTRSVRWDAENGETLTYDIRLVNTLNYVESDSDGNLSSLSADLTLFDETTVDQIKPLDAIGTYTTTVARKDGSDDINVVSTVLTLVEIYDRTLFNQEILNLLTSLNMIDGELTTDSAIAVKTDIVTECVFNNPSLTPISSQRTVKGIYVGKERTAVNDYAVSCEYASGACNVVFTDNVTPSNGFIKTFKIKASEYFDNEMLLYVIRSYDSTQTSDKTSTSLVEPLISQSVTTLYFQSTDYTVHFSDTQSLDTVAYALSPESGIGMYISLTADEQELFIDGAPRATNKIVKMQQGYLVYTLSDENLQATFDSIAANQD